MDKEYLEKIIRELFEHTACSISDLRFEDEAGMSWCLISTPDSRFLIGREGEALRSLNHLVKKMIETKYGEEASRSLMIDINGYQKKHFDNLKATAHMLAERARYFKSSIEAEPMSAYERRIIHLFLEDAKDIKTESIGMGKDRKVVIKYIENI